MLDIISRHVEGDQIGKDGKIQYSIEELQKIHTAQLEHRNKLGRSKSIKKLFDQTW